MNKLSSKARACLILSFVFATLIFSFQNCSKAGFSSQLSTKAIDDSCGARSGCVSAVRVTSQQASVPQRIPSSAVATAQPLPSSAVASPQPLPSLSAVEAAMVVMNPDHVQEGQCPGYHPATVASVMSCYINNPKHSSYSEQVLFQCASFTNDLGAYYVGPLTAFLCGSFGNVGEARHTNISVTPPGARPTFIFSEVLSTTPIEIINALRKYNLGLYSENLRGYPLTEAEFQKLGTDLLNSVAIDQIAKATGQDSAVVKVGLGIK